ncbi:response regulator [Methylobacterium nodulans]|uniref:Response regulator receiver protein n=1 Tax=Methylobacterium nodulans (strain LMG 21967 / CNCM I-2342 / ORS 2060) TaxID=460265 RepID=B8IC45_METNO|nr:response regulator [Methylobacterium nodulans]ACL61227.1 response regulator receiver protein [Methylobacterium nodulans ORS 2060]
MTSATNPLAGRRVLVVEDEYFIADDLQRQFEECGAEVLGPVPRVEEALALIAATPQIDAAVLDINLQDEMVYPVADALQARGVPFIFATGYEKTAIPARYAGVRHYEKPFEVACIAQVLFA